MRSRRSLSILLLALAPLACSGSDGPDAADDAAGAGADGEARTAARGSGSDIAEEAIAAWTANAEGVAGYRVVEETDGQERTVEYEKVEVGGLPTFRPVNAAPPADSAAPTMMALLRRAEHAGSGEVEGERTEILVIEDASVLESAMGSQMNGALVPIRMEIQVGEDGFPRRMRMEGRATLPDGRTQPLTTVVTSTDWRTVDGFAHPFRRETRLEGMAALAEAAGAQAMAEMEKRMEGMPEAQREQARETMRQRMEQMAQAQETVTVTKTLEVERE